MLMLPTVGPMEIAIVAVVVILLFGVGKLSGLGKDLGSSIKEFRHAMKDEDSEAEAAVPAPQQYAQTTTQPAAAPVAEQQPTQPVVPASEQRSETEQRPNLF